MNDDDLDTTLLNADGGRLPARQVALGLLHRGREYRIEPADTPFVIGRDAGTCDLCIQSEYSSRKHCTIEYRESKFILDDRSTNGTYVQLGRTENLRVHNETVPLIGHGCFILGRAVRPDDPDLIHFVIRDGAR